MTRWLQSGTRRDICVLIAGSNEEELPAQKLKTQLERHYDSRIKPKQFYAALEDLKRKGLVQSRTDDLTDIYSLTADGERRLQNHYEWLREQLGTQNTPR